ncbi:MAG: HAD hydrolase family protein [Proteobacteria bacterium]|nr:HAD hydrolase family protein [Pseudomonadota bacterium]
MLGRVALSRKLPPPDVLSGWESAEWIYESVDGDLRQEAAAAVAELPVDWALVPVAGRKKRLLIADMDSPIITVECLDELADFAGIKAEIAAITERAMRGELAFEPALIERVAQLRGMTALGVSAREALAVGDGANDLDMIKAAGLGIAYRAKPIVAAEARARIDYTSLETALFFQGYRRSEFVS